jgi:hypothetical protein
MPQSRESIDIKRMPQHVWRAISTPGALVRAGIGPRYGG